MKKEIIEDNKIKLFIRFLRQYDLNYNTKIIIEKYVSLKNTGAYNWWVIYYDTLVFRKVVNDKNTDFKRIFDLLWMLLLVTSTKDEKEKQYFNKNLIFYFNEYKQISQFPINDLKMLSELKSRSDVEELLNK